MKKQNQIFFFCYQLHSVIHIKYDHRPESFTLSNYVKRMKDVRNKDFVIFGWRDSPAQSRHFPLSGDLYIKFYYLFRKQRKKSQFLRLQPEDFLFTHLIADRQKKNLLMTSS